MKTTQTIFKIACITFFICLQTLVLAQWPPAGMEGDGSQNSPWEITTAEHLLALAYSVGMSSGKCYKIMNDIDLSSYDNWVGIGSHNNRFRGHFDGNEKVVHNLTISETNGPQGLFGCIEGATIQKLGVENCNVSGGSDVGALVGRCFSSTISFCHATGNVSSTFGNVGGLIGYASRSSISNCYTICNVVSGSSKVGGLVGENRSIISDCYALGDVSGHWQVGGLVGFHTSTTGDPVSISNSYATGNVNGSGFMVGGLVGLNNYTGTVISNSYATGDVIGGDKYTGGLVGLNDRATITNSHATGNVIGGGDYTGGLAGSNNNATITNSHATGDVSGTSHTGGLVGRNPSSSSILRCYATGDVTANDQHAGGLVGANAEFISECYATGNVNGTISVGGLVGWSSDAATISRCYATGDVHASGHYVGGLVGVNSGHIMNCIAAGNLVTTTSDSDEINRLCGAILSDKIIRNNYALNTMIVQNSNGNVTIKDESYEAGIEKSMGIMLTFSFYATSGNWFGSAWSITEPLGIWKICEAISLPHLRWQNIECTPIVAIIDIIDVPTTAMAGIPLTLIGTVVPDNATFQTIVWSVKDAGTTGAVITGAAGNTFIALASGTATITATIINGITAGSNFTKDFMITVTGIGIEEVPAAAGFRVYPNPTTGELRITNYELRMGNIDIFDIYGRKQKAESGKQKAEEEMVMDISHLPAGIYLIRIQTEAGTVMEKIIKN